MLYESSFAGMVILGVLLTLAVELPLCYLFVRKQLKGKKDFIIFCILINVITNLSLNVIVAALVYVVDSFLYFTAWVDFDELEGIALMLVLEALIVVMEFLMYHFTFPELKKKRLFLMSLLANTLSFGIGRVLVHNM